MEFGDHDAIVVGSGTRLRHRLQFHALRESASILRHGLFGDEACAAEHDDSSSLLIDINIPLRDNSLDRELADRTGEIDRLRGIGERLHLKRSLTDRHLIRLKFRGTDLSPEWVIDHLGYRNGDIEHAMVEGITTLLSHREHKSAEGIAIILDPLDGFSIRAAGGRDRLKRCELTLIECDFRYRVGRSHIRRRAKEGDNR